MQTNVLVRVQARCGKFLGPDAGYSRVTLSDAASGAVLAQGIAQGGSGNLSPGFHPSSTRQPVVTTQSTGEQTVLWLSALPATIPPAAGFRASLELDVPTLVRFTAESLGPDGSPNGHLVTETMLLTPGVDLGAEPGVVLVIPGLIVKNVTPTESGTSLSLTATVTMMCGCPIDTDVPWLPSEFVVTATVTSTAGGAQVARAALAFQSRSTFGTAQPIVLPGPGTYTVAVEAVQPAEANVGSASITVTVAE
ncbi:MAG TPA: hypothetical protein VFJ82_24800 [Longimicrobium sp.]|nr:hypothetical protein [Longimicrobium sp.]